MKTLRALIVEDSPDDAELLQQELTRGGYELISRRVQTAQEMQAALDEEQWNIVFSDWYMPQFGALDALEILQRNALDLPFIIVSGTVGEEVAVTAMRFGAHDFFSKDRLVLLVSAVERELRETEMRSERARMQEQLMISDRMASVGILAAGVGHEINNPLSAVIGNLDLALDDLTALVPLESSQSEAVRRVIEKLRDAHESAERIRDVATDLRLFARSESDELTAVDVRHVIESALRMARNEVRHRGRVVTDFANVPPVNANESRLGQVLLNLIVNAAQSIPEGRANDNEIAISTGLAPDGQVIIEVRDTGAGMTAAVRKRLFMPFFTTKAVGTGTGLGLSICHRIVTALGGAIVVESEPGRGSSFRVHLPAATQSAALRTRQREPASRSPAARRGTVLVVDDEQFGRTLLHRVLGADHEVTSTADAREALDLIIAGRRFDVILCDLMMPHLDGMDLYSELARVAPEQTESMIFVTGGAFTDRGRDFLNTTTNLVIDKPFDVIALRDIVEERIAASPHESQR